jgi:hypothetical protein
VAIRLEPRCLEGTGTLPGLRRALQTAVEIEHAVLPPYLYALYSLDRDRNSEIFGLIKSVVMEEMSHMGLAANVLVAIGGSPAIDTPAYPGPLPCGVATELTVPLAPFSIELVKSVFMAIEEPEDSSAGAAAGPTIGRLYAAIRDGLAEQGASIFSGDPKLQVTSGFPRVDAVVDLDGAVAAIDAIVDKGEGTSQAPDFAQFEQPHYYRFAEIAHGKRLTENPSPPPTFTFEGDPIPFDPAGVLPLVTNPKASRYPAGSPARQANDAFNATYTTLLRNLRSAFNGIPGDLNTAVGDMFALNDAAAAVTAIELGDGTRAGPSFERA